MKKLLFNIGLALTLIGLLGFIWIARAETMGWYDRHTGEVWLHKDASLFIREHEHCHKYYFERLHYTKRTQWERLFRHGSLNWTYTNYPQDYVDQHTRAVEAFADICAFLQGEIAPRNELQYWYGEDYRSSREYKLALKLLKK